MIREFTGEYATGRIASSLAHVGSVDPAESFRCSMQSLTGRSGIEIASAIDPHGWTLATVSDSTSELARLRGRNAYFDPIARMEILLPHRAGVRPIVGRLPLLLSLRSFRAFIPAPFARTLHVSRGRDEYRVQWEECSGVRLDAVLIALSAFRFWLEYSRESD